MYFSFITYFISYLNLRKLDKLISFVIMIDWIDFRRLLVSSANLHVVRTIKRAGPEGKWTKADCARGQGCRRPKRRARVGSGVSDAGRTRGSP